MGKILNRDEAWALLTEYNKEDFHLKHARILECTMRYFANELGYGDEADFWAVVGLIHDIDFEMYPDDHCVKAVEILMENDVDESIINSAISHGYGMTGATVEPTHEMEKVLFAVDELTGLIGAAALMRPSKSVMDMELKSVKKKYKSPTFAAGCSRETIEKGAEMLDWTLDDLISKTILAMRYAEGEGVKVFDD